MKHFETVTVECYAGYKGDEAPRRFFMKGKEYAVREVVARWYGRGLEPRDLQREFFKVLDADKQEYVLRHTVTNDTWELVS